MVRSATRTLQNGDRVRATGGSDLEKRDRMVKSALALAAAQGASRMTLREVAADCGVSLGLVQYYFGTKAALLAAVDELVLSVVSQDMQSRTECDRRGPVQLQKLFGQLLVREPDAVTYLARALCAGAPVGAVIFDRLLEVSAEHAQSATDAASAWGQDQLWAAINPLVLAVGTIMFRSHIERNLHQPLDAPEQLARWDSAAASLIGEGYFRPSGG